MGKKNGASKLTTFLNLLLKPEIGISSSVFKRRLQQRTQDDFIRVGLSYLGEVGG